MEHLFADPATYALLSAQLHTLVSGAEPGQGLRAWVAGCTTGEDAYAVAMLLYEAARVEPARSIIVFATESNPAALAVARLGIYPAALLARLPSARHDQLFFERAGHMQVTALLREHVRFASHRLLDDPPFSHLDLIVCRELFAALSPRQRAEALERFAFALRPGGLMLLGAAPASDIDARFRSAESDWQLWVRTQAPPQTRLAPPAPATADAAQLSPRWEAAEPGFASTHPALIVDERLQIIQLGADVERFLRLSAGAPRYDLLDAVHPELRAVLRATLRRAQAHRRAVESPSVPVTIDGSPRLVTLIVQPRSEHASGDGGLVVQFAALDASSQPAERPGTAHLAHGQAHPDEQAMSQSQHDKELRAANEELQIINEELRVSTEELEVHREELKTLNEQLRAVNREQQRTLGTLADVNADLENLIASTEIGTLFLDRALRLQRYTEPARQVFDLLPGDLGRPFQHLTHALSYDCMGTDVADVRANLSVVEHEARHADGRWFLARLRPYRSAEQQVTGVVLTFLDISERKRAEAALRQSYAELERRVQERTAELEEANVARQLLLRELVQTQEAERLRIARELHDTLGQQITAVLLGLQAVRGLSQGRAATLEELDRLWGIVQEMGREMHEIAVTLRPTALDDVGLAGALRAYIEAWSQRTAISAELFVSGVEHKELPSEVETTLYRVAQEALTNVARHAGATQVSVVLESDGSRVVTAIEDNGQGFDVEAATETPREREHLGLLGMRERAALVGGTLTIDSKLGGGTTVIARIPLRRELEA